MTKLIHPWHNVSPGSGIPEFVNGLIEIPKGCRGKYEIDKESGLIKLDRVLFSSMYYPANYGFIPQSYGGDKDPLDILVLSQIEMVPLCIVNAKVIGVMRMLDGGDADDKIIAVCSSDPSVNHINHINELPPHTVIELRNFFEQYTRLENKTVVVKDFLGKETAYEILIESLEAYRVKFVNQRSDVRSQISEE
jgi:inorganic pyrophosphatase